MEFSQAHETKNQPIVVRVLLRENLGIEQSLLLYIVSAFSTRMRSLIG